MNKHTIFILLVLPFSLFGQTVKDYVDNDWPNSRYELHGDATVTDTKTGLMWMRCSLGQTYEVDGVYCQGDASRHDWYSALEAANNYSISGYADWRLPNIKELRSIVAYDRYDPAINQEIFPNSEYSYWSASPYASNSNYSWLIYFAYGDDGSSRRDEDYYYVRLVRSTR